VKKLMGGLETNWGDMAAERRRAKRFEQARKRRERLEADALVVQSGPVTSALKKRKEGK
jgi:hypothetical protein